MLSKMTIEYYPLWMAEYPDLFEKSKKDFMEKAKDGGLEKIREFWQNGLFYMEAMV